MVRQRHLTNLFNGKKPRLIGHHLKFDVEILKNHGFTIGPLAFDTMVASYVLHPSRNSHGLKELSQELLGEQMTPIDQLIGRGAKRVTMDAVSIELAAPYACADADMTLRLGREAGASIKRKES